MRLIFWVFIWVILTWRCVTLPSLCKEVVDGELKKEALSFQYLQAGFCFVAVWIILQTAQPNIPALITLLLFIITGTWSFFICLKTTFLLHRNKKRDSVET